MSSAVDSVMGSSRLCLGQQDLDLYVPSATIMVCEVHVHCLTSLRPNPTLLLDNMSSPSSKGPAAPVQLVSNIGQTQMSLHSASQAVIRL